jgi:hypothetical protein
MYRISALVAGGANFVSEGEEKFLVANVKHQAGEGPDRKKPASGDAGLDMTERFR